MSNQNVTREELINLRATPKRTPGGLWLAKLPVHGGHEWARSESHAKRICTAWYNGVMDVLHGVPGRAFNNMQRPERNAYKAGRAAAQDAAIGETGLANARDPNDTEPSEAQLQRMTEERDDTAERAAVRDAGRRVR